MLAAHEDLGESAASDVELRADQAAQCCTARTGRTRRDGGIRRDHVSRPGSAMLHGRQAEGVVQAAQCCGHTVTGSAATCAVTAALTSPPRPERHTTGLDEHGVHVLLHRVVSHGACERHTAQGRRENGWRTAASSNMGTAHLSRVGCRHAQAASDVHGDPHTPLTT